MTTSIKEKPNKSESYANMIFLPCKNLYLKEKHKHRHKKRTYRLSVTAYKVAMLSKLLNRYTKTEINRTIHTCLLTIIKTNEPTLI